MDDLILTKNDLAVLWIIAVAAFIACFAAVVIVRKMSDVIGGILISIIIAAGFTLISGLMIATSRSMGYAEVGYLLMGLLLPYVVRKVAKIVIQQSL